jgi:hypothetical protein
MNPAPVIPISSGPATSAAAAEPYQKHYCFAQELMNVAENVGLGGIFAGGILVVAASVAYQVARAAKSGFPATSLWLGLLAVLVVAASHIWRKVFQAQAHFLEISTDTAVNTSVLLTEEQRARLTLATEARAKAPETRAA